MDATKDGRLILERTVLDPANSWEVAICLLPDGYHKFVVWNLDDERNASSGNYCANLAEAGEAYIRRGGVFKSILGDPERVEIVVGLA